MSLASMPSPLARARSRALRDLASWALPRSLLLTHGSRDARRRRVALTFDDGPDAMTPQYLDVLGRLGVRATFFFVGENAERAPAIVREVVRRGHEIGGHGWTHEPFDSMSRERLSDELARTTTVLPATGRRPMVRPPHGALSPRVLLQLAAAGYRVVLWSVDSDDCRTRDPLVVERRMVPGRLATGDIVLLHESQLWTLKALPGAVRAMQGAGWELVTVGDLME
jgi:peptidoglycan/xylan/chitin deacetylase (PgdA/CDA1 family)